MGPVDSVSRLYSDTQLRSRAPGKPLSAAAANAVICGIKNYIRTVQTTSASMYPPIQWLLLILLTIEYARTA